jgi:FkbM family methyltransferase
MIFSDQLRKLGARFIEWALANDFRSRVFTGMILDPPKRKRVPLFGETIELNVPNTLVGSFVQPRSKGEPISFERRELETMRFLSTTLRDNDVFYDIGANIGIYVLLADKFANLTQTVALEPEALNFAELCSNIYMNGLETVIALPIAAGASSALEPYHLRTFAAGNHSGVFKTYPTAESIWKRPETFAQGYRQFMTVMRLDDVIDMAGLKPPNVILMDIDGGEAMALEGMRRTLAAPELRAIIVETRKSTVALVTEVLTAHGFRATADISNDIGNQFFVRNTD